MKTINIDLYEFNELSAEAQEKALSELSEINVDYDWWLGVYQDASHFGLIIHEFDVYYNTISGTLETDNIEACNYIVANHGEQCETYKIAKKFIEEFKTISENDLEDLEYENSKALQMAYLKLLRDECEYLQTKESIIVSIEANEYLFTVSGKRFS